MAERQPRRSIAPHEITVQDGHLTMKLNQISDGWYAVVESAYEGKIFEGHVTEISELLAGNISSVLDREEPENG